MAKNNNLKIELEIIVPVYNEKDCITEVISGFAKVLTNQNINYRFIVCEDGSDDGTKEILLDLAKQYPIVLNQRDYRRGYTKAILDGITGVTAPFLMCIDSDGQCDPKDFPQLWFSRALDTVVIGVRTPRRDNFIRLLYSKLFYLYYWILFQGNPKDPSSPYVIIPTSLIIDKTGHLKLMNEGFWWGVTAVLKRYKIKTKEVKVNHRERISGKTRVYGLKKMPGIIVSNLVGLLKLKNEKLVHENINSEVH
jgi:glycosyltransferase involved in cell wall biosynthesis